MTQSQFMDAAVSAVAAGVAGQPVYRVARELAEGALEGGGTVSVCGNPDARPGRGVEAHVRMSRSRQVLSPLTMPGECQLVLGLEPLEALRVASKYFTPGMRVISLTEAIPPTSVMHKGADYPDREQVASRLEEAGATVELVDGDAGDDGVERLLERARAHLAAAARPAST